jgi:gluconolactonase
MPNFRFALFLLLVSLMTAGGQTPPPTDTHAPINANALVQKIQGELGGPKPDETTVDPNVPHGELINGQVKDSTVYVGSQNNFQVYVPAQYDPAKPACLLVMLDGFGQSEATVLDNLVAKKDVPIIIAIGISPGAIYAQEPGTNHGRPVRFNRDYEFDSANPHFSDYIIKEVLPAAQKLTTKNGRAIHISPDGIDHAATGASSGGIGAFGLAWFRPDQFTRIYSVIGTFVSMHGGHDYPAIIRKTEPKAIRVFLEDGSVDAWNPLFGSWYENNLAMESALTYAGYDVAHAWGTHGHTGDPGATIFPDVMRWLWRDYPAPIKAGISQNSTLQEITLPGEGWEKISQTFQSAAGLAANPKGDVYLSDSAASLVYVLNQGDQAVPFAHGSAIVGQAFGPEGTLYGLVPGDKKIVALDAQAAMRTVADGIAGHAIAVACDGTIYVTEPGEHNDMPSQIWQIKAGGQKQSIDQGLHAISGLAFSPDGMDLFAGESNSKWIYGLWAKPDGTFADRQPFCELHRIDMPDSGGTEDLAFDTRGNLYAATGLGIQVCDNNSRIRAIIPLPSPSGPVRSICFGGPNFDTLYATDGIQVFKRKLKVHGYSPWAARIMYQRGDQF